MMIQTRHADNVITLATMQYEHYLHMSISNVVYTHKHTYMYINPDMW